MRYALGVAVFSGMLGVTLFGIFFTPVFYVVIRWLTTRGKSVPPAHALPEEPAAEKTAEIHDDGIVVEAAIQPPQV
jgi:hypothetical protein